MCHSCTETIVTFVLFLSSLISLSFKLLLLRQTQSGQDLLHDAPSSKYDAVLGTEILATTKLQ